MYIDNTVTGSAHAATSHTQISSRLPSHISLSLSLASSHRQKWRQQRQAGGYEEGKYSDAEKEEEVVVEDVAYSFVVVHMRETSGKHATGELPLWALVSPVSGSRTRLSWNRSGAAAEDCILSCTTRQAPWPEVRAAVRQVCSTH